MYHDNHRRTRQLGILRIVGRQERPASRPISDVRPTVAIRPILPSAPPQGDRVDVAERQRVG